MKLGWQPRKWLDKKSRLGFRGHPVGTIAFYGPDDHLAYLPESCGVMSG
ncbi:MAG: hypothetical protein QOH32_4478 [Bradyrhizobium sp.]|jgi:hypothetical protein|nr:hypothetical protein [Bradyrhizobium sp.]